MRRINPPENEEKNGKYIDNMATYAMTIDERSAQGKALVTYLGTLNIKLQPLTGGLAPCRFSKAEMKSILAESTAEARKGMGTSHEDFF